MPNTLAHLGIQGLATRGIWGAADPKWIYLGCIIPDLPWILQRVVRTIVPGIDRYDLALYAGVQSSLLFCILLSGALALLTTRVRATFLCLAGSSLLHLLLDASQIKWGNGVLLFAPFSWQLTSFGFYWPEGWLTTALTVGGFFYVLAYWRTAVHIPHTLYLPRGRKLAATILVFLLYLGVPPLLNDGPRGADIYFVRTLEQVTDRDGKPVTFDRAQLVRNKEGWQARNFTGEEFKLQGFEASAEEGMLLSLQGQFHGRSVIAVERYHLHQPHVRVFASVVGLSLVALLWIGALVGQRGGPRGDPDETPAADN